MADPSGQSDGDKAVSQLAKTQEALKSNGFSSVAELVTAYQKTLAEKTKAEEARDKFNGNNDEAQTIIRTKAGEIGTFKEQVTQLEKEIEELKANPNRAIEGKPPANPPAPEETLDQVMAALTDEQKGHADALLEKMNDDEAIAISTDPAIKLQFFKGLRDDPSLRTLTRPTSFFEKTPTGQEAAQEEDVYAALMKRIGGRRIPGPSGASGSQTVQPKEGEKPGVDWLNN